MKKLSLLLLVGSIVFFGCDKKKDEPGGGDGPTPTNFSQKAVLEYFSGAWCGYCPDGKIYEENIRKSVTPGKFYSLVYHYSDNMDIPADDPINNKFATNYPTGMINRINGVAGSRGGWANYVNAVMAETAKCGLAINSTKSGDNLTVEVKLGIAANDMPAGNYFISVFLVEAEATGTGTGWDQRNYYSEFGAKAGGPTHPFYSEDDPIIGYKHTNVVRGVLHTNALGDKIGADALKASATTSFNYTFDLSGYDSDMSIVAMMHEFTDNISTSGIESSYVYNAQSTAIGTNKSFD